MQFMPVKLMRLSTIFASMPMLLRWGYYCCCCCLGQRLVCVCVFFDSFYFSPQGCCTINFIGFTSLYFPTYLFQSRKKKTNERTNEYIRRLLTYKPKLFAHGIGKENWSPKMISISNMNTNAHDLHISRKRKRKQHKRMFDSSTVISSFSHIKCYWSTVVITVLASGWFFEDKMVLFYRIINRWPENFTLLPADESMKCRSLRLKMQLKTFSTKKFK